LPSPSLSPPPVQASAFTGIPRVGARVAIRISNHRHAWQRAMKRQATTLRVDDLQHPAPPTSSELPDLHATFAGGTNLTRDHDHRRRVEKKSGADEDQHGTFSASPKAEKIDCINSGDEGRCPACSGLRTQQRAYSSWADQSVAATCANAAATETGSRGHTTSFPKQTARRPCSPGPREHRF